MRRLLGGAALALLLSAGCGDGGRLKSEPVDISGRVTAAGAPVGNVQIVFQPTGSDLSVQTQTVLGPDGTFKVKLIPGKYVYYFQAREARGPVDRAPFATAFQKVPENYRTADKDHAVELKAGDMLIEVK